MSDKSFIIVSQLASNSSDSLETPALGDGERWNIEKFGAADINLGDNKSSVYVLKFGNEILRIFALTGDTQEVDLNQDIIGNGTKKISVIRYNKSGFQKECPVWFRASKRT